MIIIGLYGIDIAVINALSKNLSYKWKEEQMDFSSGEKNFKIMHS